MPRRFLVQGFVTYEGGVWPSGQWPVGKLLFVRHDRVGRKFYAPMKDASTPSPRYGVTLPEGVYDVLCDQGSQSSFFLEKGIVVDRQLNAEDLDFRTVTVTGDVALGEVAVSEDIAPSLVFTNRDTGATRSAHMVRDGRVVHYDVELPPAGYDIVLTTFSSSNPAYLLEKALQVERNVQLASSTTWNTTFELAKVDGSVAAAIDDLVTHILFVRKDRAGFAWTERNSVGLHWGINVLPGVYDVYLAYQRGVLSLYREDLTVQQAMTLDLLDERVSVTFHLTRNGQELDEGANRPELRLAQVAPQASPYSRSEIGSHGSTLALPQAGPATISARVFPGHHEVRLSDSVRPLATVHVPRGATSTVFDLDSPFTTVRGEVTLNGAPWPDVARRYPLVFQSRSRDLERRAGVSQTGPATFLLQLESGEYDVGLVDSKGVRALLWHACE
ncbi:MAG: hypothetical protein QM765_45615 [Myxococcales bacterium]